MVQERNHRQTDAICIGNNTKKVIVTVTSEDDKIAQRHEKLGTVYKYRTLGSENVTVRKHCHDNNASISKYMCMNVIEKQPATNNQLDSWHGLKQLERSLQHVAEGDKRNHGRTWHSNLDDKPHAIRVHVSYCGGDAEQFRISFINAINHPITGNRSGCPEASRCKIATAADGYIIHRRSRY